MTEQMALDALMSGWRDGDEHGWATEFKWLRTNHAHRVRELTTSILQRGITSPVLLGNDGRVWDGHHRIYVAHMLGFKVVPVEHARAAVAVDGTGTETPNA